MNRIEKNIGPLFMILFLLIIVGCNLGPKITDPVIVKEIPKKNHFGANVDNDMHEVIVNEILHANNYIYLKVKEGNREFWITTRKQLVEIGSTYLYNEALLKTQFESKEHERIFDTLYMVTSLMPKGHGMDYAKYNESKNHSRNKKIEVVSKELTGEFYGAIKIADLIKEPQKYDGKVVELSGECIKVNPGIMNRNWIHFKDESQDSFDLVITSLDDTKKGSKYTIRGVVRLDKDFGSGYSYDILLEDGVVVNKPPN